MSVSPSKPESVDDRAEVMQLARFAALDDRTVSATFLERIPISFARKFKMVGLEPVAPGQRLSVAIASLDVWSQLDVVARCLRQPVEPVLAPEAAILAAINQGYQRRSGQAQAMIDSLEESSEGVTGPLRFREDLLDVTGNAPVVDLVNTILFEAVKAHASDLHLQPYEDRVVVRFRIDGILFDAFDLPQHLQAEVISRIKVFGHMNIAEKRIPQDGRATVQVGDREVDLRIASLPTSFGERVVIRLLDKSARIYTLGELGMSADTLDRFRQLIKREHGLILVTGPTGSGKSTTLYAALQEINAKDRNVVTLEDPIEYQLPGTSQTQVNEKKGLTFASGLRSVLRQDPDIIMIGEIRDEETAVMAIQSALTGHLVFSTLHTNDAASAVTRLLDLGIEPYLVASSVIAVMAQRLVRRSCVDCAKEIDVAPVATRDLGLSTPLAIDKERHGQGCEVCRQTGYAGRIGLFELLPVDDAIRGQIQARANASEIRGVAAASGMRFLRDDGARKVSDLKTTIEEVVRVTTSH